MSFGGMGAGRAGVVSDVIQFVSPTIMTVAQVLANYPAGSAYLGKYARVSDLYGATDEVMRCCMSGASYYWRPQRTDYAASQASTGGSMTLTPFVTAPQMQITGTLASALNLTPSSTNAWPGCTFEITMNGTLGLFLATITGLLGGNLSLLAGSTKRLIWTGSGYYSQ